MRSFIIASAILFFIILVTIFTSSYISSEVSAIIEICDSANQNSPAETAELLQSEWQDCKFIIMSAVHRGSIELVDGHLAALSAFSDSPESFEFHLASLRLALVEILNYSKLQLDDLL